MSNFRCTGRGCRDLALPGYTRCQQHFLIGTICKVIGCKRTGNFNSPGQTKGIFCKEHATLFPGMINVQSKKCISCPPEKPKRALYGENGGTMLYCKEHSPPGLRDLNRPQCQFIGCTGNPHFNYPGETKPLYCGSHKLDGMVDTIKRGCLGDNKTCTVQPNYNWPGQIKAEYCHLHRQKDMIYLTRIKCLSCDTTASFNYPTERKKLYCTSCKLPGMIEIRKNTCKFPDCNTSPSHGYVDNTTRIFCAKHAEIGMINHKVKRCISSGCKTVASYCLICETKPTHCANCRTDEMYNPNKEKQKCHFTNCTRGSCFGLLGGRSEYCRLHCTSDMIFLRHRRCEECNREASCGYFGESATHCYDHKKENMILKPKNHCKIRSCMQVAVYGTVKPLHCEDHKEIGEINLVERKCKSCGLDNLLGQDELCKMCNPENFRRIRLAKQNVVEDFLKLHRYTFTSDKTVDRGECGLERPDFLFFAGTHAVIVEVDEEQHRSRPCICEQTRMVNLAQALAMPTFFLRYNPDSYKKPLERRRFDHESTAMRLERLKCWLDYTLQNSPVTFGDFVRVMYLYYDGHHDGEQPQSLVKMDGSNVIDELTQSVAQLNISQSSSSSITKDDILIIDF